MFAKVATGIVVGLSCACAALAQPSLPLISANEAKAHLIQRVEPTIPPLAKTLKVGGTVKLRLTVSPSGHVVDVRTLSGNPILANAAVEAARQWTYKPFQVQGRPLQVATDIELEFPGGMSAEEGAVRSRFFPLEDKCRDLLDRREYSSAEATCRQAVQLSDQLPTDAVLERSSPRSLLGHSIYLQQRYTEAVPIYEEALKLDQGYLKSNDADLASDYWNLGRAFGKIGDLQKADDLFAKAVSTFEAAILNLPDMKENYTRRLKRCLNEYSQLKAARGDDQAADQLQKKAAALTTN